MSSFYLFVLFYGIFFHSASPIVSSKITYSLSARMSSKFCCCFAMLLCTSISSNISSGLEIVCFASYHDTSEQNYKWYQCFLSAVLFFLAVAVYGNMLAGLPLTLPHVFFQYLLWAKLTIYTRYIVQGIKTNWTHSRWKYNKTNTPTQIYVSITCIDEYTEIWIPFNFFCSSHYADRIALDRRFNLNRFTAIYGTDMTKNLTPN